MIAVANHASPTIPKITRNDGSARDPEDAGEAGKEDGENEREPQKYPEIVRMVERHLGSTLLRVRGRMRLSHMAHARLHVISPPTTIHRLFLSHCRRTKDHPRQANYRFGHMFSIGTEGRRHRLPIKT